MKCIFCGSPDTQVRDSRISDDGSSIRRRRHCLACGGRFSTVELVSRRDITVIKRSGEHENFDREKLLRSIRTALRKRDFDEEKLEQAVNKLIANFEALPDGEIATTEIGKAVMDMLATIDLVAYIRFASVYQDFESVDDFQRFIAAIAAKLN